ncbi:MAG: bifunctional precorrin-2 dehydrogenase/sirohydrochlorin ferrochelatase [Tissierellia bacterium]|nr:bifunctional precorrin-2 dehydrogenase/sirohydrochlorin ferrochelatase [Tissierellia bacterium]
MRYLPLMWDTQGTQFLLVGGGRVAARKLTTLLKGESKFTVIAREFSPELDQLYRAHSERIRLIQQDIDEDFPFIGYDFVVLATDQEELQEGLFQRARRQNIPVLRCDHSQDSTFLLPRISSHGDLTLGLSTGGKNPTISKIIGGELEEKLREYSPEKLEILNDIRAALVRKQSPHVGAIIESLWQEEAITIEAYWEELIEGKNRIEKEQTGHDSGGVHSKDPD